MACYYPSWPHHGPDGYLTHTRPWPCGQCIGCRLERSRQWAIRCVHEASLYDQNCTLTLTYDDEHLPENGSLHYRDAQLFFKRLRKKYGRNIRFYLGGEYGETTKRPHYHIALFNFDFADKQYFSKTAQGHKLYTSEELNKLWGKGPNNTIGALTFESAAYIARYIMKKQTGQFAAEHYTRLTEDGELIQLKPEFNNMSRRPGIGSRWLEKFQTDVYPHGAVVHNGAEGPPPRYYDKWFKKQEPEKYEEMKKKRMRNAVKTSKDKTERRLKVREKVKKAQLSMLKRKI